MLYLLKPEMFFLEGSCTVMEILAILAFIEKLYYVCIFIHITEQVDVLPSNNYVGATYVILLLLRTQFALV